MVWICVEDEDGRRMGKLALGNGSELCDESQSADHDRNRWWVIARGASTTAPTNMCPRGVMVKAMNCGIVVREFVLQTRYYVHFRANTLGKSMNPLILPPAMGK